MAVAAGVAAILADHWDTVEGDWSLHHHRDLAADVFGPGEVGVRRLRVLLEALPPDSRTWRSLGSWSADDERNALSVELLGQVAQHLYLVAAANTDKPKSYKPKPPIKWPRPTDKTEKRDAALTRHQIRQTLLGRG